MCCFLAVAEELHLSRTADYLHINQSSLSRTVKEVEEGLGMQLCTHTHSLKEKAQSL